MKLHDLTALSRLLDLRLPSNRLPVFAFVVFSLAGTVGEVVTGEEVALGDAAVDGLVLGVGAFLAWAIGRELDPDRVRSARYAVLLFVPIALLGPPALLGLVALLVALRIVLRPVGVPPRPADLVAAIAIAGLAAWTSPSGLVLGLTVAVVLAMDGRLPGDPPSPMQLPVAAVAAVAALLAAVLGGEALADWRWPTVAEWAVIAVAAGGVTQLRVDHPRIYADAADERLSGDRLARTHLVTVLALAAALLWTGGDAVVALGPALAAVTGTGLGIVVSDQPVRSGVR